MLNNEYPPLGGGTGTVNKEVLERFAQYSDLKIDLLTGSSENKLRISQLSDNIRIIFIPLKSKNIHHASNFELIKYTFLAFFKAFRMQRKEKYDFSFVWSTVPAGFVSYLLYLFFGLKYMVRVGGPDIPGFEERYKNIYRIISPIIRLIWRKSKLIIAKCGLEKEMIHKINPKLIVQIIYNGIDGEKFRALEKPINESLVIICPARLIKRKGQDLIIKALAKLKEKGFIMQLDLVGDGDEMENYRQLALELGILQQIDFKGYVPREQMENAYQAADLFILPSYNEGMSNSMLEAMACGLPVVVTDVGGTSELVKENENGFIFPVGDLERLVFILEKIAAQPSILKEMGKKSAEISKSLNWQNIVNQYYTIFNNLNRKS